MDDVGGELPDKAKQQHSSSVLYCTVSARGGDSGIQKRQGGGGSSVDSHPPHHRSIDGESTSLVDRGKSGW